MRLPIMQNVYNQIKYRNNAMRGTITAVNENGTYSVRFGCESQTYPYVPTYAKNSNLQIGDRVTVLFENRNREMPKILAFADNYSEEDNRVKHSDWILPPEEPPVAVLYENQIINGTIYPTIELSTYYLGQHFTVESGHSVNRIDIRAGKRTSDQTGIAILDLYNADEDGFPTGGILATTNIDTSLLNWWFGEGEATDWIELTLNTSINLTSGNEMVIVLRFPSAISDIKEIYWAQRTDESDLILTGRGIYSEDGGSTWAKRRAIRTGGIDYWCDFTFKIWGT